MDPHAQRLLRDAIKSFRVLRNSLALAKDTGISHGGIEGLVGCLLRTLDGQVQPDIRKIESTMERL